MNFEEMGDKLIKLGESMKNPDTTITELTQLAFDAGLTIQFRIVRVDDTEEGTDV